MPNSIVTNLSPEDLTKLSSMITAATQDYAKGIVEREAQRIPYEVRQQLEHILRSEIRTLVKEAVAAAITIEVKVNG